MAETNPQRPGLLVKLTALFAAFCGLYLLIGGVWLVSLGGSWYYPIAGLVMLAVTAMLWRGKRSALWLYALVLLATMIWGVWEVGFDFWALTPRSDILVFFGILAYPAVCLASPDCPFRRRGWCAGGRAADYRRHSHLGRLPRSAGN
jgi:Glucose dehydrogenase